MDRIPGPWIKVVLPPSTLGAFGGLRLRTALQSVVGVDGSGHSKLRANVVAACQNGEPDMLMLK